MCVCVCVCVCVCARARACAHVCVCPRARARVCINVRSESWKRVICSVANSQNAKVYPLAKCCILSK